MITKRLASRAGVIAAAAVLSLGGLAAQANASSAVIDGSGGWPSQSGCDVGSPNYFCLYYSPNHGGAVKHYAVTAVYTISDYFPGTNDLVRNDAASADNGTYCHVGIWVSPGYVGNSNWMNSGNRGGNLTSALRNNEASIAVDDSTNCPGVGIGT